MQHLARAADDDLQQIAAPQIELLRGGAAQINAVGLEECKEISADIADERRLQCGGAKWVYAQHLERVVPPGQCHFEFKHRTRQTYGGMVRQLGKQLLRKTFARTSHHDIGFTHQPLCGQAEFVERGAVHEVHRGAQGDP